MADTKLTGLSGFTPVLTDAMYAVDDPGGTPVSGKVTLTSLRDLLQANLTKATITAAANAEAIVSTGYSLTGANAQSLIDFSGTWNTTGTPTLLKFNVTDTASNAASKLLDLQVGGISKISATKGGKLSVLSGLNAVWIENQFSGYGLGYNSNGETIVVVGSIARTAMGFNVVTSGYVGLSGSTGYNMTPDVILARDAANTLALRNSTNAQAFNVYNTYTDASNYERGYMKWNSNVLEIGSESAGTGGSRSVRLIMAGITHATLDGLINFQRDLNIVSRFMQISEMTAPSAPVANNVRIYAEDNGSGKTRLMARFATGAAQQIAIEP